VGVTPSSRPAAGKRLTTEEGGVVAQLAPRWRPRLRRARSWQNGTGSPPGGAAQLIAAPHRPGGQRGLVEVVEVVEVESPSSRSVEVVEVEIAGYFSARRSLGEP
jgi:hypothetical protein